METDSQTETGRETETDPESTRGKAPGERRG